MATTMGEKGTPTPIDFSREYVIPIALQKTRHKTQINPVSLVQDNDDLVLTYQVNEGEDIDYTMTPIMLVIVSNEFDGDIQLIQK